VKLNKVEEVEQRNIVERRHHFWEKRRYSAEITKRVNLLRPASTI
jgi:hypothetical protein